MKRLSLIMIVLTMLSAVAFATEKLTEVNGVKFGWKFDRCDLALSNVENKQTRTDGEETKISYGPAVWGHIEWTGSVLDFYRDKLYQIGFYKTSATDDMTAYEQTKTRLSAAYGKYAQLKGEDEKLMWRARNGNLAVLQYAEETTPDGKKQYSTYLFYVDHKEVLKKAKNVENELRELMYGK